MKFQIKGDHYTVVVVVWDEAYKKYGVKANISPFLILRIYTAENYWFSHGDSFLSNAFIYSDDVENVKLFHLLQIVSGEWYAHGAIMRPPSLPTYYY